MERTMPKRSARAALLAIAFYLVPALFALGDARAAETWTSCTPVEVAAFTVGSKRIHVRCAQAVNGIRFFALSGNDAPLAARTLSVLTTAQIAGRTLTILYDPAELSGQAWGCSNNDCRPIHAAGFGQ